MLTENLQIYKDERLLCSLLLRYQKDIPKGLRYGEYGVCISLAFKALDYIYQCNSDKENRKKLLDEVICTVGGVRDRISIFAETRQIDTRKSTNIAVNCDRVLRQARGWKKSA